jgi:Cytidine and deoxycytidylate deaminase zinc-binding region
VWSRRTFSSSIAAIVCNRAVMASAKLAKSLEISTTPLAVHEQAMRLAIAAAQGNPAWPFGAVIVRQEDREVMASGVNNRAANHGEIVALNDYVARHGASSLHDRRALSDVYERTGMGRDWRRRLWHFNRQPRTIWNQSNPDFGSLCYRRCPLLSRLRPGRCASGGNRCAISEPQAPVILASVTVRASPPCK